MGRLIQLSTEASRFDGEWHGQCAGMGYILCSDEGKLVVVDGGQDEGDALSILRIARELTGREVPSVDLWIITHPHGDHYRSLLHLAKDEPLRQQLRVKKLAFDIPPHFVYDKPTGPLDLQEDIDNILSLPGLLGCPVYTPSSGDTVDIGSLRVRFLITYRDIPSPADANELSLVFSVTGKKDRCMFTGDSYSPGLDLALERFSPRELASGIVQVAHHALHGGSAAFYRAVGARVALVPASFAGSRAMKSPLSETGAENRYAIDHAFTVIRACTGDAVLEI